MYKHIRYLRQQIYATNGFASLCVCCTYMLAYLIQSGNVFRTIQFLNVHDIQFSCAINQPLLAHHWRVHRSLLTSRFIAPSIPWGVSATGGKMRKQLLKDHNFLNDSPIFIIESSSFNIFAIRKALHTIYFNLINCFGFGERYLTPYFYVRMRVPAVSKNMSPLKWD